MSWIQIANYKVKLNDLVRYDAAKLVKGAEDALVLSIDKHTGPVAALDFNPFQVKPPFRLMPVEI